DSFFQGGDREMGLGTLNLIIINLLGSLSYYCMLLLCFVLFWSVSFSSFLYFKFELLLELSCDWF
ncbi:MAG: hypothetical protein Q4A79_03155, partial [Candidatus Saccharibacteria bacterium]|nr:hypothetical protein [Candidatus Saccharibacteria bacterium]